MKIVLLKVSGELFSSHQQSFDLNIVNDFVKQVHELSNQYLFGIVVGGGNFFRGGQHGQRLNISRSIGDSVGMLATIMNALILKDFFDKYSISATVLSHVFAPGVSATCNPSTIRTALARKQHIIFAGGTGNPYLSTDTNAVLKALYIGAKAVWKATKVDFLYDDDPVLNPKSKPISRISIQEALEKKLGVMDLASLALASEHDLTIRIFNMFAANALKQVASNEHFGSTVFQNQLHKEQ